MMYCLQVLFSLVGLGLSLGSVAGEKSLVLENVYPPLPQSIWDWHSWMRGSCFQCWACAALRDLPVLPNYATAAYGFCHPHKSDSGSCRESLEVPQPRRKLPG